MAWFVRKRKYAGCYSPRECPDYPDPDYFNIKVFHGGEFDTNRTKYSGGLVDYVDNYNVDIMSLIEINAMLKDCGIDDGAHIVWYKSPLTTMKEGLYELESDDDVMTMCQLMLKCKYFEVYVSVIKPLSQVSENDFNPYEDYPVNLDEDQQEPNDVTGNEEPNEGGEPTVLLLEGVKVFETQGSHVTGNEEPNEAGEKRSRSKAATKDPAGEATQGNDGGVRSSKRKGSVLTFDFEWPDSTQFEINQEQEILEEEGIYKDFTDYEDDNEEGEGDVHEDDDNSSVSSFYSDESNKDQSDDELILERDGDKNDGEKELSDEYSGEDPPYRLDEDCDSDKSSVYANSDEERMCANSTDDEDEISSLVS